jgi:hypothetical protein
VTLVSVQRASAPVVLQLESVGANSVTLPVVYPALMVKLLLKLLEQVTPPMVPLDVEKLPVVAIVRSPLNSAPLSFQFADARAGTAIAATIAVTAKRINFFMLVSSCVCPAGQAFPDAPGRIDFADSSC